MELNDTLLDFWLKNNYNVLLCGRRGTGKTLQIKNAFERNGLKWKYFSAPTMDPWVDFVGVPKETKSESGNSYIELIRPKEFADDEVEAIFFDEFNRAKPKTIDAAMELIQFKSINGRKFKNLRVVWAAVNPKVHDGPGEEEYAVEELDPAHKDRFHVFVETDYKLNEEFFHDKFPELAEAGISWWNKLKPEEQSKVSPRRLEYALDMYAHGGDVAYVLPKEINPSPLVTQLSSGSFTKKFRDLYNRNDPVEIRKALLNENFYNGVISDLLGSDEYMKVFAAYLPNEKFNNLITNDLKFKNFIFTHEDSLRASAETLKYIIEANAGNPKLIKEIKDKLASVNLFEQTKLSTIVENKYNELSSEFLAQTVDKRRICGVLQGQDTTELDDVNFIKANVIIFCILAHTNTAWLAVKLVLRKFKKEAEARGMTFAQLFKKCQNDAQYKTFVRDETAINNLIKEEKFFDDDTGVSSGP